MSVDQLGRLAGGLNTQPERTHAVGHHTKEDVKLNQAPAGQVSPTENQSIAAQNRHQLNRQIVEASLEVSLRTGNESMSLVYKAAVDKINEILAPEMGNARPIETAYKNNVDMSPEATADRIVSLTTGFFAKYQESNPDLTQEELVNKFIDVIGSGIEQGFNEARDILDGLGVLEGSIAENIDKTFSFVQQGLQDFKDKMLGKESSTESAAVESAEITPDGDE